MTVARPPTRLKIFAYVDAEKAPVYRRVMRTFLAARDGFRLHLRPLEVLDALGRDGVAEPVELSEVESALRQLSEWGNVVPHQDTAEVQTVEEFYRPRFLFQLTAEGEAAERAVNWFEQTLRKPGELQTAALQDIRTHLAELAALAEADPLDQPKVVRAFDVLRERFTSLTDRAQAFMASLQRGIDLHGIELQQFLHYKERLIDYLERFIGELVIATSEISDLVARIEAGGVQRLLAAAAERELVDRLAPTQDEIAQVQEEWTRRWEGLRSWFVPQGNRRAQAEVLRASARAAIPQLLSALAGIHDRRVTRTDRAQDFRTLARWFSECSDEDEAHRLYRAAFGLAPARHLSVDAATLEAREHSPIPASRSWLDAPPLLLSPRLRATGRTTRRGRANSVIDRRDAKEKLARLAAESAARLADAEARIATGRPFQLSEVGPLQRAEFDLLLDLVGDALGSLTAPSDGSWTSSADGTLQIRIEPPPDGRETVLETDDGALRVPDFRVTIRRTSDAHALDAEPMVTNTAERTG